MILLIFTGPALGGQRILWRDMLHRAACVSSTFYLLFCSVFFFRYIRPVSQVLQKSIVSWSPATGSHCHLSSSFCQYPEFKGVKSFSVVKKKPLSVKSENIVNTNEDVLHLSCLIWAQSNKSRGNFELN